MREVKFRGKMSGRWCYVSYGDEARDSWEWEQFWSCVDSKTVGQTTGLVDKNGHDIYEGDILKHEWYEGSYTVVYEPGALRIASFSLVGDSGRYLQEQPYGEYWEIVGNVYDNSESE